MAKRVLILLFFGSGCSALIYEVVWFQLLELITGSSAISIGVLLGIFMGGMCLGSLVSPRVISPRHHPLRVYALLELGIGVAGLLVLFGLPYAGGLYVAYGGRGLAGLVLRGAVCGLFLLPPTFLMGATLPAVARWLKATPDGVSWLGFFYSGNIAGGAFGSLFAGFYLLREFDMAAATYVAASINAAVAVIAWVMSRVVDARVPQRPEPGIPIARVKRPSAVYIAIAISGLCALGAEVVWTRVLSLMLAGTVYTFSLILAAFLIGLGIGAQAGSVLSRRVTQPALALASCQLLLIAAIAWSAYMLSQSLPYWPIYPTLSISPWISFQVDFVRCLLAVLPAALLWGASFPLALASAASPGEDSGGLVARIYAANTAGAIVGALSFSLVFIKTLGMEHAQQALIGLSAVSGLIVLAASSFPRKTLSIVAAAVVAGVLVMTVSPIPPALTAYGRLLPLRTGLVDPKTRQHVAPQILYQGDGLNASVAVSSTGEGKVFHVSGKAEASTSLKDMQLQRMLGDVPLMFHPRPRSVLIVGFGAGVTAGTFVLYPGIERIVICEIEPLIPQVVSTYFEKENNNVLHDPRVEVVYDDARHFILTTNEKFDIITSDPIHPWVKGSAALYTREYFDLVRRHLNPGGIVSQWVPLYDTGRRTVKSELATFFSIFPNATLWSTYLNGAGQDLVIMGGEGASSVNLDDADLRLYRPEFAPLTKSLVSIGFTSAIELLSTYAGRATDLMSWLSDAEINSDRNLRLQYTAGSELNLDEGLIIYQEMIAHRNFPADLFSGTNALTEELKRAMARRK
jgi:spermidine synthase